ncbi:hypothetical protein [Terrarubrum flagellatum]|uniref:hypothetical protein n=1 Tax=Terrirubrum flagellatum TaxID=2895980 RepID=UPI003144DE1C
MKFKLLHFQIATAALLAPVAVSLASPTVKAPVAKTTTVAEAAAPAPVATAAPVLATEAPTPNCAAPKVRVVYSGYAPSAPKGC